MRGRLIPWHVLTAPCPLPPRTVVGMSVCRWPPWAPPLSPCGDLDTRLAYADYFDGGWLSHRVGPADGGLCAASCTNGHTAVLRTRVRKATPLLPVRRTRAENLESCVIVTSPIGSEEAPPPPGVVLSRKTLLSRAPVPIARAGDIDRALCPLVSLPRDCLCGEASHGGSNVSSQGLQAAGFGGRG